MSISPIEHAATQRIGSVEFVAPNEIQFVLDLEAPADIAANAGIVPRSFPRINGYVLVTSDSGYVVAQVEWIAIERSPFPKRKGFHEFGLVDLPFPLRKMRANPLGVLQSVGKKGTDEFSYQFKRGVQAFPSVGEPVLIPTDKQLRAVVESGENRKVKIGTSPLAANAEVKIDPNRLFGRHLAILGNTGSGKSCSVAGLIQWCLEEAEKVVQKDRGENRVSETPKEAQKEKEEKKSSDTPNARFIILDPNGEYSRAFNTKSNHRARVFRVGDKESPLAVPLWFWNSAEWCSVAKASAKVQAPLLRQALKAMRNEEFERSQDVSVEIKIFLRSILQHCIASKNRGTPYGGYGGIKNFTNCLEVWIRSIDDYCSKVDNSLEHHLKNISAMLTTLTSKHKSVQQNGWVDYYPYDTLEISALTETIEASYLIFGGNVKELLPKHEDIPTKFSADVFINYLEVLAQETGNEQHLDYLLARIRTLVADTNLTKIVGSNSDMTLEKWLSLYVGSSDCDASITVIDLSLVPIDVIHLVTAVIARMTFEALQRYRIKNESKNTLPTVLVAEEAHTFIKRYKEEQENQSSTTLCTQIFEKIAREGRKFGLGLVLSSQRPSELSPTVLSQCNSFLLHRISNDKDQELVSRLVPDNLRGLLRELPSLPSQHAILLGWASELPVLVRMNDLREEQRPFSNDPDFWNVWTRKDPRTVDWKPIVEEWQMRTTTTPDNVNS